MEYVYELNLPPFREIILESFSGFNDDNQTTNFQYGWDINTVLKPEWARFKNFTWDHLVYFKKDNFEGQVHTDLVVEKPDTGYIPWGINWIYEGDGLIEYWNFNDVIEKEISTGSNNNSKKGVVRLYTPTASPIKTYHMYKDRCYMVNARQPHRATGFSGRKAISLRCSNLFHLKWEDIIKLFESSFV